MEAADLEGRLADLAACGEPDAAELVRRTRHVVTEIERTRDLVALLRDGRPLAGDKLARAGALMDASHESLRADYECTCPELDAAVEAARAAGAHGARMTGGGFGGSAIALVNADIQIDQYSHTTDYLHITPITFRLNPLSIQNIVESYGQIDLLLLSLHKFSYINILLL